jgi:rare lipoprotein A
MLMSVARYGVVLFSCFLAACSMGVRDGPPDNTNYDWSKIPNATPKVEPKSRYGNPANYEVLGKEYHVMQSAKGFTQNGIASWYGSKFHGQRTSDGEVYDMHKMTAAHKTLPLPSYVEVTNHNNGRKIIVRVNDRGPFHKGRIIDLSYAAAAKLGVTKTGTAPVTIRVVTPDTINDNGAAKATAAATATIKPHEATRDASLISDEGKLFVQVVAYSTEDAALKMLKELRDQNFSGGRIHVEKIGRKLIYRVRIGPVPTRDVAEKLLAELKEFKFKNAKIVSYN